MRKFPYYCLGCERVIYLERYDIGKTSCPRCGSTKVLPVAVAFPNLRGGLFNSEKTLHKNKIKGGAR